VQFRSTQKEKEKANKEKEKEKKKKGEGEGVGFDGGKESGKEKDSSNTLLEQDNFFGKDG
jgi:hypothetical protein